MFDRRLRDTRRVNDTVWAWLRGILPAEANQSAVIKLDSWHHGSSSVEIRTDREGRLRIANRRVVEDALGTMAAGETLVVQVCSTNLPTDSAAEPVTITRMWVFDRTGARAVDAQTLRDNLPTDDQGTRAGTEEYETGWIVTGEPGGAGRAR